MNYERYEHLDSEQSSRAAALEIAATNTADVVEHLDRRSRSGKIRDAPKGGLRSMWGQLVDGEPPKASTDFNEYTYNEFADVTMRFAQYIEAGFDPEKIDLDLDADEENES